MIKKFKKYGKNIILDYKENANFEANGSIFPRNPAIIIGTILYLVLLDIVYLIYIYLDNFDTIIVTAFLGAFFIYINYGFRLSKYFRYNFPDYIIKVRGNEKISAIDILDHELFHLRIIEKGSKNKELIDFLHNKLDEMTQSVVCRRAR